MRSVCLRRSYPLLMRLAIKFFFVLSVLFVVSLFFSCRDLKLRPEHCAHELQIHPAPRFSFRYTVQGC